jgi:hypothetical protein
MQTSQKIAVTLSWAIDADDDRRTGGSTLQRDFGGKSIQLDGPCTLCCARSFAVGISFL